MQRKMGGGKRIILLFLNIYLYISLLCCIMKLEKFRAGAAPRVIPAGFSPSPPLTSRIRVLFL